MSLKYCAQNLILGKEAVLNRGEALRNDVGIELLGSLAYAINDIWMRQYAKYVDMVEHSLLVTWSAMCLKLHEALHERVCKGDLEWITHCDVYLVDSLG